MTTVFPGASSAGCHEQRRARRTQHPPVREGHQHRGDNQRERYHTRGFRPASMTKHSFSVAPVDTLGDHDHAAATRDSGGNRMTTTEPSPDVMRTQRRRAIVASTVGTTVEWYDFFLYGTAAALIFPKLFFPSTDSSAGILLAFGTQFVGFAARPVGAAIFGHYGDRIGRKATLVATLLIMGIC